MSKKQLRNLLSKEELEARLAADPRPRTTLSFYQYANITEPQQFRDQLFAAWTELDVLGRVYVAFEGVNGQISLPSEHLDAFRAQPMWMISIKCSTMQDLKTCKSKSAKRLGQWSTIGQRAEKPETM